MKNLSSIARQFNDEELLNEIEAAEIKGGRRYVTKIYSLAQSVISLLKSYGYKPQTNKHGDEYCIEW